VPGKFWGARNQHLANAPVSEISFQMLQEMLEQVRNLIANNARSHEDVQQRMASLEQQIVKLDEHAVHARNARQQDLVRQVLTQKRECESKLSGMKRLSRQIADEEQRLSTDRQLLEANIAVAALREGRPWQPDLSPFTSDAPIGERNSRFIPQDVRIQVAARDKGKCRECGSNEDLHFDHVIPWSKNGANTVNNIQLLCGRCNRRKGADDIPARW
jgi:5-methylcytosine-specific restriction endonuclease McrA